MTDMEEHYRALWQRADAEASRNKCLLFDAWKALRQQQKGMNRMARKIKRLQSALNGQGKEPSNG
jgi:hypothetical protein